MHNAIAKYVSPWSFACPICRVNISIQNLKQFKCSRGQCFWSIYHTMNMVNTLRPRQNWRHFPDDIFKCILLNENGGIPIKISLKFVPKVPINNIQALVKIMAWCRPGDKPVCELMMVSLPTHKCVTRPQWVKLGVVLLRLYSHFRDMDTITQCFWWICYMIAFTTNTRLGMTMLYDYKENNVKTVL